MNSNDFIVLPWGKAGNSVKLKAKNVKELQVEKVQLELETQEMEKKLQQLQSSMSREKEERERSSGFHWKSGQPGKLGNQSQVMSQNKENVVKISPGKVKLKILKDQMQAVIKQPITYKVPNTSTPEKTKGKGKLCGQCENKYALLVCLECGEDYCSGCFAKIHQKGALKRHRTTLLETRAQVSSRLEIAHRFLKEIYPDESQEKQDLKREISKNENASKTQFLQISDSKVDFTSSKNPESTNKTGGLLLEGSFDEEESARSFQEILTQWRNGNHENKERYTRRKAQASPEQMEISEVQTNLKIWGEPLQIEFKDDSLTYVERLWLKKHRSSPLQFAKNIIPEKELSPSISKIESSALLAASTEDITLSEKDINIEVPSFPDLFLSKSPELEHVESFVKIEELDDNYEEEPGGSGDFVPYKVELADVQQSWTVHQYQKNYFYFGKGIPFSLMKVTDAIRQQGHLNKDNDKSSQGIRINFSVPKEILKVSLSRSSTSDSPQIPERVLPVSSGRNITKKEICLLGNRKPDEKICVLYHRTPSHCSVDLGDSHGERSTHNGRDSLEGNNFHENSNTQCPISMKSSELQKIALRSKPITHQYKGLERFFVFGKNPLQEQLRVNLAKRSEISPSNSRITLTGNQQWISESSLSEHADDSIVEDVVWNNQKKASSERYPQRGKLSRRPSSVNIPICKAILNSYKTSMSVHQRSRSMNSRPISRATSEISEIEYLDATEQNEPFFEDAADHQTLDNLERELNALNNLSDAPERLYNLNSEKLSDINSLAEKIGEMMTDSPKISGLQDFTRLDVSNLDAEIHCLLSSPESIDDEEENSLEKLQVIALN